jgi:leucine dehydrogenase
MDVFKALEEAEHEQVSFAFDEIAGLRGIVAIHSTVLGPAIGGTTMRVYEDEEDALEDALRLSFSMTYKAAAAGLNFGGGAAVIMGDPDKDKSEILFRAVGRQIESLNGRYITSQGMGTDVEDMERIRVETKHVVGLHPAYGGCGDPSPVTAHGAIAGLMACLQEIGLDPALSGMTVAVQGLGKAGSGFARALVASGAKVVACDTDPRVAQRWADELHIRTVAPEDIYDMECDIWSPCAVGEVINEKTIGRLKCRIVAGLANNQLAEPEQANALAERGILYAPDFVFNSGALIAVTEEIAGFSMERAMRRAESIYLVMKRVFRVAHERDISTAEAANVLAEERIRQIGGLSGQSRTRCEH